MKVKRSDLDELLARHGIAPLEAAGSDSQAAARGGTIASIGVEPSEDGSASTLRVTIDGVRASSRCPLDEAHARSILRAFTERRILPSDTSLQRLFAHLLAKISKLYLDAGLDRLNVAPVHLHPASYHIDAISAFRQARKPLRRRLAPDTHDRRAVFAHRGGDSQKFPRS